MPNTEIIKINYADESLDLHQEIRNAKSSFAYVFGKRTISRDDEFLLPKVESKRLDSSAYRAVLKKNKTKIIKARNDSSLVRKWHP